MSDDMPPADPPPAPPPATSRRALMLGAVGASAVISIRPALAQAAGSVLMCEIKVPDQARAGNWVSAAGKLVPAGTKGAFPPAPRPYRGEEVRRAMTGTPLPGADAERTRAYVNYIRRLQQGQGGFTCFASLQSPRR